MESNDYYEKFDANVAATHDWRSVENSVPDLGKCIQNREGLKILDVGCGPGSITYDLYENYGRLNEVVGVDTVAELVHAARKNYCNGDGQASHAENGNTLMFTEGSIYALPFADDSFDVVFCNQVLIHLEDPCAALCEMKRVCRKVGLCGKTSYLFACEAEIRSLLLYPAEYQDVFCSYFNAVTSRFTKRSFGLGLTRLFAESETLHSAVTPRAVTLGAVPWCINESGLKRHFARMYIARLGAAGQADIHERYRAAWNQWALEPDSPLVMVHGLLRVEYQQ